MPRYKSGGRLKTSPTPPPPFSQKRSASTETKYYGLRRDSALSDIGSSEEALNEVLTDIQDPSESLTLGKFVASDLQVIDGAVNYSLKKEDFEVLRDASINLEDENGSLLPLVNPRQRISDRIKQFEGFAGRGTQYQGQGTALFKYYVPTDLPTGSVDKYSHANPPPFFTEAIGSSVENAPDFIPTTPAQIQSTHRLGYVKNGAFIPFQDPEWWWNGEYDHDFRTRAEYGNPSNTAESDPKFPIVRDGNIKFDVIRPEGISTRYNWGLRFDAWWRRGFDSSARFMKWAAQVNGHLRIDYFEKTGYVNGVVQGSWKTALDTTNPATYYEQIAKENPTTTTLKSRKYLVQGGPSMPIGTGTGTLGTQRSATNGSALDLNAVYADREGISLRRFNDDYVPVVIRFWYGQPSTDPADTDILTSAPLGPASFCIDMLHSDITEAVLPRWNDYSSQIKLIYVAAQSAWAVDTTLDASPAGEANYANYMSTFEILARSSVGPAPTKPGNVGAYTYIESLVIAEKTDPVSGVTYAKFTLPGITPTDGHKVWVIGRNRPYTESPDSTYISEEEMWQRYLFYPSPTSEYTGANDLLDGVGQFYREPNPARTSFESNTLFYKAKLNQVPLLGTYGPARYDGMIQNSLTEAVGVRDYDYSHDKLLFVGRQQKSTSIRPLASGEVRIPGENYTFIEVIENEAGLGGNVVINAYPTNNLGVLTTSVTNAKLAKFLHMADNAKTFTNPSRQNVSISNPSLLPTSAEYTATTRVLYEEIAGQGRISIGTWNGTAFTYDATGIIAKLTMGNGATRSHLIKSGFLAEVIKPDGGGTFSFYGLIGALRPSVDNVSVTVALNGANYQITSEILFPNNGDTSNNNKYIGTEIIFDGDATPRYVTAYSASTQTVTFSPSKPVGTYANTDVWYNHLSIGGVLPSAMVNSTGDRVTRTSVVPTPSPTNLSSRLLQLSVVYNSAYQFSRADNGAGLSYGETLYVKQLASPTATTPFEADSELPSPPADIVIPFGYDNSQGATEPGLGGLCYPPYSIQNIALQELATNDVNLYAQPEGNFDMWWGGRNTSETNLGNVSLTITDKLLFDFASSDRESLLQALNAGQKPALNSSQYTHKLEVELRVGLPTPPAENANLYNDVKVYSNNKPVKDKYYLFVNVGTNNSVELLTANNPGWV